MPRHPSKRAASSTPAADGGARHPLWREAVEAETTLRPVVPPKAHKPPFPWGRLTLSLVATALAAVVGGIDLYRRGLVMARMERPPLLRGPNLADLPRFLRPRVAVAAWEPIAIAGGVGLALWLVCLAVPRLRPVAWRWGWIPGVLGVAGYVYVTLRMTPLPR